VLNVNVLIIITCLFMSIILSIYFRGFHLVVLCSLMTINAIWWRFNYRYTIHHRIIKKIKIKRKSADERKKKCRLLHVARSARLRESGTPVPFWSLDQQVHHEWPSNSCFSQSSRPKMAPNSRFGSKSLLNYFLLVNIRVLLRSNLFLCIN